MWVTNGWRWQQSRHSTGISKLPNIYPRASYSWLSTPAIPAANAKHVFKLAPQPLWLCFSSSWATLDCDQSPICPIDFLLPITPLIKFATFKKWWALDFTFLFHSCLIPAETVEWNYAWKLCWEFSSSWKNKRCPTCSEFKSEPEGPWFHIHVINMLHIWKSHGTCQTWGCPPGRKGIKM